MEARKSSRRKRDGKTIFNIFFMLSYFYIFITIWETYFTLCCIKIVVMLSYLFVKAKAYH